MSDLKQLLESSVLNEESKAVIAEAFDAAVAAKTEKLEQEYEAKLVEAKSEITKDAAALIEEAVSEELEAISEEVTHARTIEVQYAEKLKTFKESYAEKQEEAVKVMVAEAVAEEIEELKEDIEQAKKVEFAVSLVESFGSAYAKLFGVDDVSVVDQLEEAKKELGALKREKKLNDILESVAGEKRDIVMTLLESTPTEKLEARFESLKTVLLSETKVKDKEEEVISESTKEDKEKIQGKVILENEEEEDKSKEALSESDKRLARSLRFAGV